MNQTILYTLFLDNPELPAKIASFCDTIPDFVQVEQEYDRATRELIALIGFERYDRFESALTNHLSNEVRASYLFGLGLRRELIRGLGLQAGAAGGFSAP